MPLLAEDVSFSYPQAKRPAVCEVSLRLDPGELVLLLGTNGSGKSTLVRLLNGLYLADRGRIWVDGLSPERPADRLALRRKVGLVFQHPENQVVAQTVSDEVAFGLENLNQPADVIRRRVDAVLRKVALADLADRRPDTLSGGQLQRLALAGVLALAPDYVFMDEPFAWLDQAAQQMLWEEIQAIRNGGCGVVIISQETDLLPEVDRVWVMQAGRLIEDAAANALLQAPEPLAQAGLAMPPLLRLFQKLQPHFPEIEPFCNVAGAVESLTPWLDLGPCVVPPEQPDPAPRPAGQDHVTLDRVGFDHDRRKARSQWLIQQADLRLSQGDWLVLGGPSGSGKSSFVQLLNGLLQPLAGEVRLAGRLIRGEKIARLCRTVGLVFQNPRQQFFAPTVEEEMGFALGEHGLKPALIRKKIEAVCRQLDLSPEVLGRRPQRLSGGEQLKVALGSVLLLDPQVLVLDESLTPLDVVAGKRVLALLQQLQQAGLTLVTVTHRLSRFSQFTQAAWLEGGRFDVYGRTTVPERWLPDVARLSVRLLGRRLFAVDALAEALVGCQKA